MKGVIFNIFEDFVVKNAGDEVWEESLEKSGHDDKVFVAVDTYDDSILLDIFGKVLELTKLPADAALRAFGEFTFDVLKIKYKDLIGQFNGPREFLEGLDSIIHVEVRKIMAESNPPEFIIHENNDKKMVMEYRSERKLCQLGQGLYNGMRKHYSESVEIEHIECEHSGGQKCLFEITFKG